MGQAVRALRAEQFHGYVLRSRGEGKITDVFLWSTAFLCLSHGLFNIVRFIRTGERIFQVLSMCSRLRAMSLVDQHGKFTHALTRYFFQMISREFVDGGNDDPRTLLNSFFELAGR